MVSRAVDGDFDTEMLSNKLEADQILPLQTKSENEIPEVSLWRAVIMQALQDAGSKDKKREMRMIRARAIAWLHSDSDDFREVCMYAEFELDYVKKKAKEAIKQGCKWRKDAGYKKYLPAGIKRPRGRPRKSIVI